MPNMQSIRTIHLHPVCSIWANDRICFLKCLEFSIFKIPPELVCMILQPYYEWWSILLSYYDSVTHSNQICQRIGFGKWFALALKVSWLLAGRRLDCRHPLGRPAGIKHCFWDQFPQKMHHFRIICSGEFRRDLTGVSRWPCQEMWRNWTSLSLDQVGKSCRAANWEKSSMFEI